MEITRTWQIIPEMTFVSNYVDHPLFLEAWAELGREAMQKHDYDKFLFSYHGLPERQVDKVYEGTDLCGDQPCEIEVNEKNKFCYKATSYATTRLIAKELGLTEKDYTVCFQSRLDKKWLTPFSDKVVEEWAEKGAKKLLVFSPAFVADCLETVHEVTVEYGEEFRALGGEHVQLVESLNDHPLWIDALVGLSKGGSN
jgi:ferrochelatase